VNRESGVPRGFLFENPIVDQERRPCPEEEESFVVGKHPL